MGTGRYFVISSSAWTAKGSGIICRKLSDLSCSNDVADNLTPSLPMKKAGFAQGSVRAIPLILKNMLLDAILAPCSQSPSILSLRHWRQMVFITRTNQNFQIQATKSYLAPSPRRVRMSQAQD